MEKFNILKGVPANLPMINVDTDMIIPKQFLKTIKRTGLGKSLFFEMRYDETGKENKEFINSLIEYYISESESYREIAEEFRPEIESVQDTAFGIITGCVYSGFLQAYQNQQQTASLEDIKEFNEMIKEKAPQIK